MFMTLIMVMVSRLHFFPKAYQALYIKCILVFVHHSYVKEIIFEKFQHTDLHNIKIFCFLKDTVRKIQAKATDYQKVFAKYLTKDPYLEYIYIIYNMYTIHINSYNLIKQKFIVFKWAKNLNTLPKYAYVW